MLNTEQQKASEWIAEHSGLLLARPGTGKTRTVLAMAKAPMLIIAPASVATNVWQDEEQKCGFGIPVVQYTGRAKQRDRILDRTDCHIVVSYELSIDLLQRTSPERFQTIVFDESTKLRNPTGVRYQFLSRALRDHPHKIGLTGTPVANHYHQLYGQLASTAGLPFNYDQWLNRYFISRQIQVGRRYGHPIYIINYIDAPNSYEMIAPILMPRAYRMPPPEDGACRVMDHWVSWANTRADSDSSTLLERHQIAQGRVYDHRHPEDPDKAIVLHKKKQQRLEELLQELNGAPVIVFYQFRHDIVAIREASKEAGRVEIPDSPRELAKLLDDWDRGEINVLVLHPASAGHGLNLQKGGSQVIWYALPADADLYEQGNRRVHRRGQAQTVVIHRILARRSIDQSLLTMLAHKRNKAEVLDESITA